MFEDCLEDAYFFVCKAQGICDEREAKRNYRASVFYAMGAIEAFINFIADTLAHGDVLRSYEIAYLQDRWFGLHNGQFKTRSQADYHRLEDKLKLLIRRFLPDFDFEAALSWSRLLRFKKLRDALTHPREDEDKLSTAEYKQEVEAGLSAVIEIMSQLSKGIFGKPLRKKLTDLSP